MGNRADTRGRGHEGNGKKKNAGFYIRSAKNFFSGMEDKDGNKKEPIHTLNISGLGEAINVAVAAASAVEGDSLGKITKCETSYPDMASGRGCARINVTITKG